MPLAKKVTAFTYIIKASAVIRRHRSLQMGILLEFILLFIIMAAGLYFSFDYSTHLVEINLGDWQKEGFWWQVLYYTLKYILLFVALITSFFLLILIGQILLAPLNTWLSERTALLYSGRTFTSPRWWGKQLFYDIWYELKKALVYITILVIQLPLFFIPFLGQTVLAFTLPLTAMFTTTFDLLDYSMERDLLPLRRRLFLVTKNPLIWLTFGGTIYTLFLVPLINVLLWPYLIVAATMLYEDTLAPAQPKTENRKPETDN